MDNSEFRINPNKVTHIKISDKHKGIKGYFGDVSDYIWLDGKVSKILGIKTGTYDSGFYLSGSYSNDRFYSVYSKEHVEKSDKLYINGDEIWTRVQVDIYIKDFLLKTKYFESIDIAKRFCDNNLKGVNLLME